MFLKTFFVEGLAHASYMVGCQAHGVAAVIDPKRDVDDYVDAARAEGMSITHIFDTHIHADYVSGARELAARTGAKICLGETADADFPYEPLENGQRFKLGNLLIQALHTPGHTPEHVCLTVADTNRSDEPWMIFTGDTLFVGEIGRPDLLDSSVTPKLASDLYDSLHRQILTLPDGVEIYPGHGAGSLCGRSIAAKATTTIGYERKHNYALQEMGREHFIEEVLRGLPPFPPYFKRMKKINKEGPAVLGSLPWADPLAPRQVQERVDEGHLVVDLRDGYAFGSAHVPGAYNIEGGPQLATWAGWVLPPDVPLILIDDRLNRVDEAVQQLARVGYTEISGFLAGGMAAWSTAGLPIQQVAQITVQELREQRGTPRGLTILDVRSETEYDEGHIPGVSHLYAGHLADKAGELKREKPVAVICATGYRSSVAASLLKRLGFRDVRNVVGGMDAWIAAGYELEA